MFGILVVSHDQLASELVRAARNIVGEELEHIKPVSIGWEQNIEKARKMMKKHLDQVSGGGGAIILTDMFGGTPTNISLTFLEEGKIEIVTGVNLPMLIKLALLRKEGVGVEQAAKQARERGRQTMLVASEILGGNAPEEEK
jgi:PTS system mannose-specific IIA component